METYKNVMEIELNPDNPRTISDRNKNRLINSLLCFPDMLSLRPVIVNADGVVLGGNMRTEALREIALMEDRKIVSRLKDSRAKGIIESLTERRK